MNPQAVVGNDERIMSVYKRHWFSVVPIILVFLLVPILSAASLLGLAAIQDSLPESFGFLAPSAIAGLVSLLAILFAYASYVIYRDNAIIVTHENLYNVTRHGLFSRVVVHTALTQIQDVSAAQHGFIETVLGFGQVRVETAGDTPNFLFKWAIHPDRVTETIMEARQAALAASQPSTQI